ncbi:nuclear transport factor 2-like protein [Spirosoma pollinicola]|uniref:SnoaL-like domain-containing protein n=1 Tax=Spirosoma pollinicola TaxID=2057025 RepID=A0A2K8Z8X1_9BACT|nr:hypothetical protein [Spirosoma pollinicola]AUD06326.1 hypothetical protein CWM47_33485 [Spirosoma pollinicola]
MKYLAVFLRLIYGRSISSLVDDLHARFIGDWLEKPESKYVHPHCSWTLADGHPSANSFFETGFYAWYHGQFGNEQGKWKLVVSEVIGSPIGAIVVGQLHYQDPSGGGTASFTHFYRIRQGKIVNAHYFIGEVAKSLKPFPQLLNQFPTNCLPSLN